MSDAAQLVLDAEAAWQRGDYAGCRERCERAIELLRRAAPGRDLGRAKQLAEACREMLGAFANPNRLEEAFSLLRDHGAPFEAGETASLLGGIKRLRGDVRSARLWLMTARRQYDEAGARLGGPGVMLRQARLERDVGEHATARALLEEALAQLSDVPMLGARYLEADCAALLGDTLVDLDEPAAAALRWSQALGFYKRHERQKDADALQRKLERVRRP